jgi:hypothetical protein
MKARCGCAIGQAALNKKPTNPDVSLIAFQISRNQPTQMFFFFIVRFLGASQLGKGNPKTSQFFFIFFAKIPYRKLPPKTDKIFDRFFIDFFRLSRFRVFLSDGSSKTPQNRRVENNLQKNRPKYPKPIFSRFCYIAFLGVFGEGGFKNTNLKKT